MEATLKPLAGPGAIETAARETLVLSVPAIVCGACIRTVETTLRSMHGVDAARANLSTRRVSVSIDPSKTTLVDLTTALKAAGFPAAELTGHADNESGLRASELLPRVGVAGFAAANIMLLSVSVWSGQASDMDSSVATLFHWLSALIALPAIGYAGMPFFRSAVSALSVRRLNMDVPISLGVILATVMSLFQTMRGSEQVYFDAATTLLFFLLIGRTLDEQMRVRARGAAENLLSLKAINATLIAGDGSTNIVAARSLVPGSRILIAAGEKVAGDGFVVTGASEIDESLLTGETAPRAVLAGDHVHAGTINGGGVLTVQITSADDNTLLTEIGRLMLAAEQNRGRYVLLADRAAQLYAPAVHVLGLLTFTGWMLTGAGWELSLTHAIAVLIITCPCALALAVPAVQVAAMSRLFNKGVIVKAADGLERLAEIDYIVFDKTGTLTTGDMQLTNAEAIDHAILQRAASLAASSRHPYAQALVRAAAQAGLDLQTVEGVREVPGSGLTTTAAGYEERLGSALWVKATAGHDMASLWYARAGLQPVAFTFSDELRDDAAQCVGALQQAGYAVELLSGDRQNAVEQTAQATGLQHWTAEIRPDQKLERIGAIAAIGRKALMVGDGLNDAPALAGGHASLSPASAVDIAQTAADAVFQGEHLGPVIEILAVAKAARRMSLQNFAIAILYNLAFVPLAMAGYVTPLVAALAMSSSSIIVTVNALRLRSMKLGLAKVGVAA